MFFFQKITISTWSALRHALVSDTKSPVVESTLAEATLEPCCTHKYAWACVASSGRLASSLFQNLRGSNSWLNFIDIHQFKLHHIIYIERKEVDLAFPVRTVYGWLFNMLTVLLKVLTCVPFFVLYISILCTVYCD